MGPQVAKVTWGSDAIRDTSSKPSRLEREKSHVALHSSQRGESIQQRIKADLRLKGAKLIQIFNNWDRDKSNTISRDEFREALMQVGVIGGVEDYDSLFDAWDADASGEIQYTELLGALSGRRYDAFDSFDADISNAESKIAAAASQAYIEAAAVEGAHGRKLVAAEAGRQIAWARSKWRTIHHGVSAAIWLHRVALGPDSDRANTDSTVPRMNSETCADVQHATDGESLGDVDDSRTVQLATQEAKRLTELALVALLDASAERQLAAEDGLKRIGVCREHMNLESAELLPLLYEMQFARVVGSSSIALSRMPPPAFYGPLARSFAYRPLATAILTSANNQSETIARVVVARASSEDISWLRALPPQVDFHIMQKGGTVQPEFEAKRQTVLPNVGGTSHSFLSYLQKVSRMYEGPGTKGTNGSSKGMGGHGRVRSSRHAVLTKAEHNTSIQERIHAELRRQAQRVQDLFRKWDRDKSNTVSKVEFRRALQQLGIVGGVDDYDSLFDAWDVDASGEIQYTELLRALSGSRYDAFKNGGNAPPIPPLVIFTPADPFSLNPRWLEDVELLISMFDRESETSYPFTPLGHGRGDAPCSTDLPSWCRPEIFCDPSGCPQSLTMLPLAAVWRSLFGNERPLPLWIGYTPGQTFAVARERIFKLPVAACETASSFYTRALSTCALDRSARPVADLAMERVWRHIFAPDA